MPSDERENLLPEECGLQNEEPANSSKGEADENGDDGQSPMVENAARLDEIEALLLELSSEFRASPDALGVTDDPDTGFSETDLPTEGVNDDTVRLPATTEFDLAKPVDYFPNPEGYDYRRASEAGDSFSLTAQSMASRLVPAQTRPSGTSDDDMTAQQPGHARSDEAVFDDTALEPARPAKRRMRLRPARRVSGSRPEPRVPWATPEAASTYSQEVAPAYKPTGQTGRGFAIGAAVTVLVIGGAAATVAYVKPIRPLLPVQLAQLLEGTTSAQQLPVVEQLKLAEAGSSRTEQDTGSFKIASGAGEKPMIDVNPAGTGMDQQVSEQSAVAPAARAAMARAEPDETIRLPEAEQNAVSAVERQGGSRIPGKEIAKSAARLNQDSNVQATLKDPQKLALQDAATSEDDGAATEQTADTVVTGSITSDQQTAEPVKQPDQAEFRTKSVQTTPVPGQPDNVAQIRPRVSTSGASAYAPPPPDVGSDVPFPGTRSAVSGPQTASLAPQSEIVPQQPVVRKPLNGIEGLLARGHELLENGQIASARLLFRRVASMGDERGAKGMGMTFDPEVYKTLPVAGVTPDSEKAEYWYRKANELARHKRIPDSDDTDARSVEQN